MNEQSVETIRTVDVDRTIRELRDLFRLYGEIPCSEEEKFAQGIVQKCMAIVERQPVMTRPFGQWMRRGEFFFCSNCLTNGSPTWKSCPICDAKIVKEAPADG